MHLKAILTTILCMATLWVAMPAHAQSAHGKLIIALDHFVGDQPLITDTVTYKNALGQPFTVTKFKYYIGEIHLYNAKNEVTICKQYFLIDEDEPVSKKIELKHIPDQEYTSIELTIGVDSASNCSGAQSGALDPANAMFWAWNTGYVFLKLEGKSPISASPGHLLQYHIGGYKTPANCIRTVRLQLKKPLNINSNNQLHIKVDASEILKTPTAIDFTTLSSVTDFHYATTIADNYADMFSIEEIK